MKSCKKHPHYRAIRRPTSGCARCRLVWLWRCIRKNLGLTVPTAKPRTKRGLLPLVTVNYELRTAYKPVHPQTIIPIIYKRRVCDCQLGVTFCERCNPEAFKRALLPASELPVAPENRGPE